MELFRCPVCGAPLTRGARVLVCPKRHSFDLAAEGYAHLLPAAQMHAKIPGDSRKSVFQTVTGEYAFEFCPGVVNHTTTA